MRWTKPQKHRLEGSMSDPVCLQGMYNLLVKSLCRDNVDEKFFM